MSSTLPKQKKSANSPKKSADKLGKKKPHENLLSFPPEAGGLVGRQSQISSQEALNQWLPQPSCLRPPRQQRRFEEEEIPGTHTIHGTGVFTYHEWLIFVVNVGKLPV